MPKHGRASCEPSLRVSKRDVCPVSDTGSAASALPDGDAVPNGASPLRVFVLDYFRKSAIEDGHNRAGHGQGLFLSQQQERQQMGAMKANRDPA